MSFSYHTDNTILPQRTIDLAGFGKVAIITGCASGIGLATTKLFLAHQYEVLGVDIGSIEYSKIDPRDQERFHFHKVDLTAEGACDETVRICIGKFGDKIDVLANIAGVMDAFQAADTMTDDIWEKVMGINLTVPTKLIRAVLPFMKARKNGSIINIGSKAGTSGASAGLAYTTSKHALLGVTKHTAWRFKNDGIRCNAVLPGVVDSNISSSIDMKDIDQVALDTLKPTWALNHPIEKPGMQGSEIANVILFLASDQARMINGVALPVDNAWSVI